MIRNAHGKIHYGLHFYPGVAEYQSQDSESPYRVFLNEDTLRRMDPTFAGKPIFVEHVDEVDSNLDELRKEADGWVVESFFNSSDGKHWVKMVLVSERAERAIAMGMRLSNAYVPKEFKDGGLWNGVSYSKEITDAEYEHLAIVKNPRYEESVIMTPEEFKLYNERNRVDLKKLSNSQGDLKMKFSFFKKTKVENELDPEMSVLLPRSGKEVTIAKLVNDMDAQEMDKNSGLADLSHKVKMHDGSYCNVGELLEKHKALQDEMESMKAKKEDESEKDPEKNAEGDDEEAKKKALQLAEHEEKEIEAEKKKNAAKEKAERLRNAHEKVTVTEAPTLDLSYDKVARGKERY